LTKRLIALVVFAALLTGAACTRSSSGSSSGGGTPEQIYAAGPTVQDVRSTLGSDTWWPATPSFRIRPLGLPTMSQAEKFTITQHFIHVGSSEQLAADYTVWTNTSFATALFSLVSNQVTSRTGPRAGDQSLYFGSKSPGDSSLYDTSAVIRLGQVIMEVDVTRGSGYVDTKQMGQLANKMVSRLKAALKGAVKPSPLPESDQKLLLPLGTDVTLAAAVRLPVEVAAELLGASSPQDVVDSFTKLNVKDFLFGDYALNADLNMEVRAIVFSFSSPDDASGWIDLAIGKGNLDASGVVSGYASSIGEYYAFILAGSHVGLLFCNSLSPYEAASRACESPIGRLVGAWQTRLA
jgi:hypothetical protein